MRTLQVDPAIANKFMLALNYEPRFAQPVMISMPKLNGLRAMYIPGKGWYSRDGVQYSPAVTNHIQLLDAPVPVDGEFYRHGWDLQRINAAVGVNLDQPVEDTKEVQFFAFDLVSQSPAVHRMAKLHGCTDGEGNTHAIPWKLIATEHFDKELKDHISKGYEGQMLKAPYERYRGGRDRRLMKRKDWKRITVKILGLYQGEGEMSGMLGGFEVEWWNGTNLVYFDVGCGKGLDHARRFDIWKNPKRVLGLERQVRYLALSTDGKPLNGTIEL